MARYFSQKIKWVVFISCLIVIGIFFIFYILPTIGKGEKNNFPVKISGNQQEKSESENIAPNDEKLIRIKDKEIIVKIANTGEKRTKGLMDVNYLEENRGMLFIFEPEQKATFWNKNTFIPLDIIWIKDKKIIKIDSLPSINSGLTTVISPGKIDWVIETNYGWAKNNNISENDIINIDL